MKSTGTASWESNDFPILCDDCLGDNPYIRMTRQKHGTDCKVCLKPYSTFRWCPASSSRFRQTAICQTCARLKNVCQSCIFDIEFGLPVSVRDSVLSVKENPPKQAANREYYLAVNASKLKQNDGTLIEYSALIDDERRKKLEALSEKFKQRQSDQNRRLPCSFYAKGACSRGDTCPYRHDLVTSKVPTLKSYRDKYYGEDAAEFEPLMESAKEPSAGTFSPETGPAEILSGNFAPIANSDAFDDECAAGDDRFGTAFENAQ